MKEGYTPGEYAEVEDRRVRHNEAREEAKFYRELLNVFYGEVLERLKKANDININPQFKYETIDLNNTTHKLKEFKGCSARELEEFIRETVESLYAKYNTNVFPVKADVDPLLEMTPLEFHRHIQDQKSSLIK